MIKEILIEQVNVSDDQYKLVELNKDSGESVNKGDHLLSYESSKAVFEYEASESGYLYVNPSIKIEEFYDVGFMIAVISSETLTDKEIKKVFSAVSESEITNIKAPKKADRNVTKKALTLIKENSINIENFDGLSIITESHVKDFLRKKDKKEDTFIEDIELQKKLDSVISAIDYGRKKLRNSFNRHIPAGSILNDRWKLAQSFDWGIDSSAYDETLIFGDVMLGKNCWVGPFTILDGNAHPILIGDWTSIGSGTHIYTHHTIDEALSGGNVDKAVAPVTIGRCCFISPQVIIAPGSKIGNHCFITAQSYVEGSFEDFSIISGTPAKVVGKIEVNGDKVQKIFFND